MSSSSSLCGPSNALSSLQKHTTSDRTLQQDRLAPSSSQQQFRTPQTQADTEFSQFTSAPLSTRSHSPAAAIPAAAWASDFQRLHIAAAPPPPIQQQQQQQQQWALGGGWQDEFLRSQPQQQTAVRRASPMGGAGAGVGVGYTGGLGMGGQMDPGGWYGHDVYVPPSGYYNQQPQQQQEQHYDDAAFEAAFENARVQLELASPPPAVPAVTHGTAVTTPLPLPLADPAPVVEEPLREDSKEHGPHPDDLAHTAGNLLDSLRENQSEKFQQSTFLALMRRLRDREVVVEGGRMVEAVGGVGV